MSDDQQRFLIQYLYGMPGNADVDLPDDIDDNGVQERTIWSFGGKEVCFPAFVKLLGSSRRSICQRCRGFVPMPRTHRVCTSAQTLAIDTFWVRYWHSNAEPLPLDGWSAKETFREGRPEFVLPLDEGSQGFEESSIEDWAIGEGAPELLSKIGNMDALRRLPQRYLPHGRLIDYYWEFVAHCQLGKPQGPCEPEGSDTSSSEEEVAPAEPGQVPDAGEGSYMPAPESPIPPEESQVSQGGSGQDLAGADCQVSQVSHVYQVSQGSQGQLAKPPGLTTFHRRWFTVWRHVLRIRKSSQHAECSICFKFRQLLRSTRKTLDDKLEIAHQWRHHLYWQYCDRCVYWSLRWGSRMKEDVLVIIIDALDRSKFMLPKYRFQRKSSTLDGLRRPRVVVTGGIAHGYCRHAFITGESVVKGGSAFVEMLAIIIEQVYKIRGGTLPSHLVAFADNTVAQAKNEEVCLFLSALVALCHFRTSNLLFLTEGHTHEDIGMD